MEVTFAPISSVRWFRINTVIALRGSTIEKLHNDWRAGMTIVGAASAGRRMGMLGLACIFSTLVAVDGPLLQKATRVVYAPVKRDPIPLSVSVLPELPTNLFAGYTPVNTTNNPRARESWMFNHTIPTADNGSAPNNVLVEIDYWMYNIQGPWLRKEEISNAIHGCPTSSHCRLKVRAPALVATACTSYYVPVNYSRPASDSSVSGDHYAPPLSRQAFIIDISLVVDEMKEKINVITGYANTPECVGVLNYTACTLEAVSAAVRIHRSVSETLTNSFALLY